jgi:hypothetical protein
LITPKFRSDLRLFFGKPQLFRVIARRSGKAYLMNINILSMVTHVWVISPPVLLLVGTMLSTNISFIFDNFLVSVGAPI